MGQVSVTLNNRTYRLACNDGEEPRLAELARDVKSRVENLARDFGQPADERILLMAAVLLADELMDLREAHEAMLAAAADVLREAAGPAASQPDSVRPAPGRIDPTPQTNPGAAKSEAARPDPSKPDVGKPEAPQQNAGKMQQRPSQPAGTSGSGHPAMPQSQAKGPKTSAG